MAQHGGIEPWRLPKAVYCAVTARLILGNMGRGNDYAKGEVHRCRAALAVDASTDQPRRLTEVRSMTINNRKGQTYGTVSIIAGLSAIIFSLNVGRRGAHQDPCRAVRGAGSLVPLGERLATAGRRTPPLSTRTTVA
jgi:hypothetical protein